MTSNIDNDEWDRLSPLLDQALELAPAARETWLAELATGKPELAAALAELLAEKAALDSGHFLEDSPAAVLGQATLAGQRISAYEIDRLIGQGGMGAVWLAHRCDGRYQGNVAVKLLNASLIGGPAEQRFLREGSVLAALQHPNIAHLIDAGVSAGGQPYLILEYVEGCSVTEYCDKHRLGIRARLRVFLEVLEAVAYAHRHLVVHRDLKPSNVLVTNDGVVKLLDFGIAMLLEPAANELVRRECTREIGAALTPEFAAPEQLRGEAVTTATDIFALGRVLYVLLGGARDALTDGRSAAEFGREPLDRELPLLSQVAANAGMKRLLRGDLDNIVKKALKSEPQERYATVEAFADDLRHHLVNEPVTARPDSVGYRVGKFVRRHRGGVLTGALTAVALVGTTGFAFMQMLEAQRQRDEAQEQTRRAEGFNQIVTSLLSQAGPNGRALGPGELLDRAVEEVTAKYTGEPAFLVDVLIQISNRYFELRDTNKEYATLVQAEVVARDSGNSSLLLNVLCNSVETQLVAGRMAQAQLQMQEARLLLTHLRDPPPFLRVTCLRSEAELAAANQDMERVFEHLERAQRVLEADELTDTNAYAAILSKLGKYHSKSGHLVAAYEYSLQIVEIDRRAGRLDSMPGLIGRISVAINLYHLGQVQRSLSLFREAVPDRGASEPGSPPSVSAKAKYGEMLARAGRLDVALPLMLDAVAEADRRGHHADGIRTRLLLANALVFGGRAGEAEHTLEEATALMQQDDAVTPLWLAEADRLQSEALLAGGRVDAAAQAVASALERLDRSAGGDEPRMARVLLTRARVQLGGAEAAAAAESARAALALFEKNTIDPEQSADVGEALLVLAQAELAAGNRTAARRSLDHATPSLHNALGADHRLTLLSEVLRGRTSASP